MKKRLSLLDLKPDTGAALVTVLLLVSVMAIGAVVTFEALGYSIKRSSAQRQFDQAGFYALGGEQLAVVAAEAFFSSSAQLHEPRPVSFEIEGGRIEGSITDASNCFNINNLVERRDIDTYVVRASAAQHYRRLLMKNGYNERQSEQLTAALIDWIDSDTIPMPSGAEDYDYGTLDRPYRTANTLVADVSELYLIRGYDNSVISVLKPFICTFDTTAPAVMNINTMTVDQAPLLVALVGGNFRTESAVELILSRPGKGYDNLSDFWLEPILAGLDVNQSIRKQTSVKPQYFKSKIRVNYFDAIAHLTSVIQVDEAGVGRLVSHQQGVLP